MKRFFPALILGVLVSAVVLLLHFRGALAGVETVLNGWLSGRASTSKFVSEKMHFPLVFLLAGGVAWMTIETGNRRRLAGMTGVLIVELFVVGWVCALYQTVFQPLPAILATALALGAAAAFVAARNSISARPARVRAPKPIAPAVAIEPIAPPVATPVEEVSAPGRPAALATSPSAFQVTAVVCDIGNKHDLIDELEADAFIALTQRFIAHATRAFTAAGAHVDAGSGEGVTAIFGYPETDPAHAEKATREAMRFVESFTDESGLEFELHAGVSSGKVVIAPSASGNPALTIGEPVELARRFCIANRFYGSRVLIGPQTFELAAHTMIARPIDFLAGVDARERHEIYEPLSATTDVAPDEIRRRDSFWNGVVLYREKRWAEAYAQFQQARGPNESSDAPLQLYLRRLEPLALQLIDTPFDE